MVNAVVCGFQSASESMKVLVIRMDPTPCNLTDCSPPVSSVRGILQTRILKWVAILFSRGSSQPRDRTWSPTLRADYLPSEPPGKPTVF